MHDPNATVWRGDRTSQSLNKKVFGLLLGRDEYVWEGKSEHHDVLFERIPLVPDVQVRWLLLSSCATRANFYLWNVSPESCTFVRHLARHEGAPCLCQIVGVDLDDVKQSTLPFHLGGLGQASAVRTREGVHWRVGLIQWRKSTARTRISRQPSSTDSIHELSCRQRVRGQISRPRSGVANMGRNR